MPILVVALSARALALAAHRAGAAITAADFFGDLDTRALAPWISLPGDLERGIDRARLPEIRSAAGGIAGIVYGAGFEQDPGLLHDLSAMAPLIGNPPDTVALVKDPWSFAALLKRLGLPHPAISRIPRYDGDWLMKQPGGSGGTHIRSASAGAPSGDAGHYFQARAAGSPVSALFAANGRHARVLGFSAQWTAPARNAPFRFGGCAGPLALPPKLAGAINEACDALVETTGLVGLNSLDMLIDGEAWTILEVNPRPGATIDIFDGLGGLSLWEVHCRAAAGELPPLPPRQPRRPRAAATVYADRERQVPAGLRWGRWTADIPAPLTAFPAGAPVCTVMAQGNDIDAARSLALRRAGMVLRRLPPSSHNSTSPP
jgi:predicted ATP-grasp superfamily ATP-dependent carboligase